MSFPALLPGAEIAELRSALARLRDQALAPADRDQQRDAADVVIRMTIIAAALLVRSDTGEAAALGREVLDWIEDDGATALAPRQRGGVSPARDRAISARNEAILRLWGIVPDWSALPPIAAARLMAMSAERYERDRWPRESENADSPSAEPAATWWRILSTGLPIPKTKQLARILTRDIQSAV